MACNIYMAHGKHCPFCAHGWEGQAVVMVLIIAPQIYLTFRQWTWPVRALAALAMFPAVEGLTALVLGWRDGYWSR
jgi:hypothetical protein